MTSEPEILYRPGSINDISGIADVLVRSWRSAYRSFLPADFLDAMSVDRQMKRHGDAMAKGVRYAVAISATKLVGFASWGPKRFEMIPADSELYTIYVDPDQVGRGIGPLLLKQAKADLSRLGNSVGVLVMKKNLFRGFYEKHGFQPAGESAMDLGGFSEINIIYVCKSAA